MFPSKPGKLAIGLILFSAVLLASCEVSTGGQAQSKSALQAGSTWDGSQTPRSAQDLSRPIVMGYYPSWSLGWVPANGITNLSLLPDHVNHVIFSFAKANLRYTKGSYDISQTGIQSDASAGKRLALAIELLRSRGTKVILSLGGETYWRSPENYTDIHYDEIKDLVDDYGFDGIDWDYEPQGGFTLIAREPYKSYMITFIRESRKVMPKSENYLIMTAPPGVGTLGGSPAGQDSEFAGYKHADRTKYGSANAQGGSSTEASGLFNFETTGSMIPILNASGSAPGQKIGNDLDLVAYQSYNTGASLNRTIMYDAWLQYAKKYGFALAHGTHVPPEPWGNLYVHTPKEVGAISKHIYDQNQQDTRADGIMIWQLYMNSVNDKHNGISYLKIAADILGGSDPGRYNYRSINYGKAVDLGTGALVVGQPKKTPAPGTAATEAVASSYAPADKSLRPYDPEAQYADPGYLVSYQGKIYQNAWWTQGDTPGETKGANPWKFQADATENPQIAQDSPALQEETKQVQNEKIKAKRQQTIQTASTKEFPYWKKEQRYAVYGTIVKYGLYYYQLRYWSQAEEPTNPQQQQDYAWVQLKNTAGTPFTAGNPPVQTLSPSEMIQLTRVSNPNLIQQEQKKAETREDLSTTDPVPWVKTAVYPGKGYFVTYKGKIYKSQWYVNAGAVPGAAPWNGWKQVDENGNDSLQPGRSNITDWSSTVVYPGKDYYVRYNKKTYRSRWYANAGETPGKAIVWEALSQS